ncbi:MAG: TonB-dependent receptor [Pseudomonadota bacterium]
MVVSARQIAFALLISTVALCAAPVVFSPAAAQPAAATNTGADDVGLSEIIVTARRREERAQDVGIAITALTGDALIDNGIATINNLENFTPNLEIENQFGSAQPSFSIRGIGFRDYATLNAPTVGIYVDDVAYPVPVTTQGVLFDVARAEVLRGPQGTLYGRNTTGGAIKLISNRPTDDFAAGLTVEAGRFGRVNAEGYVSGALSDGIRARLAATTTQGGDWQVNRETGQTLGAANRFAARALVDIDLGANAALLLNVHGTIDQSDGLGLQLFEDSAFGGALAHTGRRETSFGISEEFAGVTGLSTDEAPFRDNAGLGGSATLTVDLGSVDLIYVGSYEHFDRTEFNDFDANSLGAADVFFQSNIDVSTHEVRLSSGVPGKLVWTAGLYGSVEYLEELYQSDFVASFGPGFAVSTPYNSDVRTIGIFGQAEYQLTDQVRLIGGLRYEDENRELNDLGTFASGFGPFNFANGSLDGTLEARRQSLNALTGRAAIEVSPSDTVLVYASFNRGVKSGGFTAYNTLNPRAVDPFEEERLNAIEVGVKAELNNRIRLNLASFYYDYQDQQVQSAIFDEATGAIVGRIVNAPESTIYGAEGELLWQIADGLTLSQSLGYKEGTFQRFTDLDIAATGAAGRAVFVDRAGQSLGFPTLTYQGALDHEMPLGSSLMVRTGLNYAYRSALELPLLGPNFRVDGYWLVNAQLAVGPADGPWEVSFWGRNITNSDYDETRNFFTPGASVAAPGQVATYGVRLRVSL